MTTKENEGKPTEPLYQTSSYSDFFFRVLIAVGIVTSVTLLILLLVVAYYAFLLIFAGILVTIFLRGVANLISKWTDLPPGWSLVVEFVLLIVITVAAFWFMSSSIINQFIQLAEQLPRAAAQLRDTLEQFDFGREILRALPEPGGLVQPAGEILSRTAGIFSTVFGFVTASVIIFFIGVYCSINPDLYINGFLRLIPKNKREHARHILRAISFVLQWWLIGRIISMLVLGLLTGLGLWFLGVPLPLALGVLTGVLTFIPYIGAIISFIPILLLALSQGLNQALYAFILYMGVQAIEGYLLIPVVEKKAVSLPPSVVLVAQVMGGILFGIMGIILASPLAATAMVLVRILYIKDVLRDDIAETLSYETDAKID